MFLYLKLDQASYGYITYMGQWSIQALQALSALT